MRLFRTRRRSLVLLSTRAAPAGGLSPRRRLARRRFRFIRTGTVLAIVGVLRLARVTRSRWRISMGFCGVLLEILGHTACPGAARGAADLLGLVIVIVAVLKSDGPVEARRAALPQAASRWQG